MPSTGAPQSAQRIVAAFLGTGAKAWLSTSIAQILLLFLSCVVCRDLLSVVERLLVRRKDERRKWFECYESRANVLLDN